VVALSLLKLIRHATLSGRSWSDYSDENNLSTKIILFATKYLTTITFLYAVNEHWKTPFAVSKTKKLHKNGARF